MIGLKCMRMTCMTGIAVLGVMHTASNAEIIMTITDDGTDLTMTATGTYDMTQATVNTNAGILGANAAVAPGIMFGGVYGWEAYDPVAYEVTFIGSLTGSSDAFPASSVSTTNPFYFWMIQSQLVFNATSPLIGSVNEVAVFEGVTLSSLGMVAGETVNVSWTGDSAVIMTSTIPAPGALALLGFGMLTCQRRRR